MRTTPRMTITAATVAELAPDDTAAGESGAQTQTAGRWRARMLPIGTPTDDGRMFSNIAPRELPLAVQGTLEENYDHIGSRNIGHMDKVEEIDGALWGEGPWATTAWANEVRRAVRGGHVTQVSPVVAVEEWELIVPAEAIDPIDSDDDGELSDEGLAQNEDGDYVIPMPMETMHVTKGLLIGLTVVPMAAFSGTTIEDLNPEVELVDEPLVASVVPPHETGMTDDPWDAAEQEGRIESPMSIETVRAMYAWFDGEAFDENDQIAKSACKFPHHMVAQDGTPGVANLHACAAIIAALNGGRGGADIPAEERQGVYDHIAKHYDDADLEAPPLDGGEPAGDTDDDDEAMTAAGVKPPMYPPASWFDDPELAGYTPLTITDEGRIYGHVAAWEDCHIGLPGCTTAPTSKSGYAHFMVGEVICEDGTRRPCGALTMTTGHAPINMSAHAAAAHYDNTGTAIADLAAGEDDHGIWVAGALRPDATPLEVRQAMAAGVSGDWRPIGGEREFVALLCVNVPGFNHASPRVTARNTPEGLVAAMVVRFEPHQPENRDATAALRDTLALFAGRDRSTRRAELRALVHQEV